MSSVTKSIRYKNQFPLNKKRQVWYINTSHYQVSLSFLDTTSCLFCTSLNLQFIQRDSYPYPLWQWLCIYIFIWENGNASVSVYFNNWAHYVNRVSISVISVESHYIYGVLHQILNFVIIIMIMYPNKIPKHLISGQPRVWYLFHHAWKSLQLHGYLHTTKWEENIKPLQMVVMNQ